MVTAMDQLPSVIEIQGAWTLRKGTCGFSKLKGASTQEESEFRWQVRQTPPPIWKATTCQGKNLALGFRVGGIRNLWLPFECPKKKRAIFKKDPKSDPTFDNVSGYGAGIFGLPIADCQAAGCERGCSWRLQEASFEGSGFGSKGKYRKVQALRGV